MQTGAELVLFVLKYSRPHTDTCSGLLTEPINVWGTKKILWKAGSAGTLLHSRDASQTGGVPSSHSGSGRTATTTTAQSGGTRPRPACLNSRRSRSGRGRSHPVAAGPDYRVPFA